MKHYRASYFAGQAVKGLWRNGVMSFASVAVLMSCLVVLGGFSLLVVNINENLERLGLMNDIVVFVDYELSEEQIVTIEREIKGLDYVGSVERVTADDGIDKMMERAGDYGYLYEMYKQDNPLSDLFVVKYTSNEKLSSIVYSIDHIEGVRSVRNQTDLSVMVEEFKDGVMLIFLWFLIVLFIVSIFVIINTVKLSVYSRKNEIGIMRYIGATGWFISLPFIMEGALIGLTASVIAYFIESYFYKYIVDSMTSQMRMIQFIEFGDLNLIMLAGFVAIGVLTGVIGSTISLSKYTKN